MYSTVKFEMRNLLCLNSGWAITYNLISELHLGTSLGRIKRFNVVLDKQSDNSK